jgi:hypothetical protein
MRIPLLAVIFTCIFAQSSAQEGYVGMTVDFNTGIGERYTYGLGLHTEMRCPRTENLYFNWHYGIGSNTHGEVYGHAGLSLMLYRSDTWWNNIHTWDDFLGTLLGPLLIPNGVTYYLPQHSNACRDHRLRIGMYCNPIAMEYWNTKPLKVTSWTVEGGCKLLWETKGDQIVYLAGGVSFTNNLRRDGRSVGFGNEQLIHIQLGLLGIVE